MKKQVKKSQEPHKGKASRNKPPFIKPVLQTQLMVNAPGDKYEVEADRMANKVAAMPNPGLQRQADPEREEDAIQQKSLADQISPLVQRKGPEDEEEPLQTQRLLQKQDLSQEEEEPLQLQSQTDIGPTPASSGLTSQLNQAQGGGQPLTQDTEAFMSQAFGYDFGEVRIHTDKRAQEMNQELNARAFTHGKDVFFNTGQYDPTSPDGKKLLGHELTHVVQQQNNLHNNKNAITSYKTAVQARHRIDYKKARKLNQNYSKEEVLGWGYKLPVLVHDLKGAKLKVAKLFSYAWELKRYDQFADFVAKYQQIKRFPTNEITGVMDLKTWGTFAGLGEAVAGIPKVVERGKKVCTIATDSMVKQARQLLGKKPGLEKGKRESVYNIILQSIPERMKDIPKKYRGSGAAGAIVYAGWGEFVSEKGLVNKELKPGAVLQVWMSKSDYDKLQSAYIGKGKRRRALSKRDIERWGTSMVFFAYEGEKKEKVLVLHKGKRQKYRLSQFEKVIAANFTE